MNRVARNLALVLALAGVAPLLPIVSPAVFAADEAKPAKKPKLKKNQALVAEDWAARNIRSIAMMPLEAIEGDEQARSLTRAAIENALADRGYKLLPAGSVRSTADRGDATPALAAATRGFHDEAPLDSVSAAALHGALRTDVILLTNLTQWKRYMVDPFTRGASFTQVGFDGVLFSLVDGAVLWRGNFLEKLDGPYNEPQRGDQDVRDPGQNAKQQAALEPPLYEEVLDKLMLRAIGTMPKPAPPATTPAVPAVPATPVPAGK